MAESGMNAVYNQLITIYLQGRHNSYPKRRELNRMAELLAVSVNVAFGHDDIMAPWYPMGSHDMAEIAHMGHTACSRKSLRCVPCYSQGKGRGLDTGCHF